MQGTISYIGTSTIYAFKLSWSFGQTMTLEKFRDHLKTIGKNFSDDEFVSWVEKSIRGKGFTLSIEESENASGLTSKKGKSEKTIEVEATELEVASSMQSARERLKSIRHPEEVGEIVIDQSQSVVPRNSDSDKVAELKNQESKPITGDDFNAPNKGHVKSSVMMLNSQGEAVKKVPTSKEEQEKANAEYHNSSGNVRVFETEPGNDKSFVVKGNNKETPGNSTKNSIVFNEEKKNKYVQTAAAADAAEVNIYPQTIVNEKDPKEIERYISLCSDVNVLRAVRTYYKDNGQQRFVDKLDSKIQSLSSK